MEIEKYGIKLIRLTEDKIELVRKWRNSDDIRQYMIFKEEITPKMQQEWFNSIDNDNNFYFLIYHNGECIGLSNVKDISYKDHSAEAGIFIADNKFLDSDIPIRTSLCGIDWCFDNLGLTKIYGSVLSSNSRAIKYNKTLGFKLFKETSKEFYTYILTKESYYQHRNKLIDLLWN